MERMRKTLVTFFTVRISSIKLSRPVKGGIAMMTIEIDGMPPEGMIEDIRTVKNVTNVFLIRSI